MGQRAKSARRKRVIGISFQFDRPPVSDLDQSTAGGAAAAADRSKPTWHAGSELNGLPEVRNNLLLGRAATAQRQGDRGITEYFQKGTTRNSRRRRPSR